MALLHGRATLHPTKQELLAGWLPGRGWCDAHGDDLVRVAAYRFDDPAGAVGIETMLVRFGDGPVYQVPLTYRDAPLDGAERWLIGTAAHSVLGRRWVYDACGDPVYAAALAAAILGGTGQADELVETDGRLDRREPSMSVTVEGLSGDAPAVAAIRRVVDDDPTRIVADTAELTVVRRLTGPAGPSAAEVPGAVLRGAWPGQPVSVALAYAAPR